MDSNLPTALLLVPLAFQLTKQGNTSSWCQVPGLWQPICDSNHPLSREDLHSCNWSLLLCPLPRAQILTWLVPFPSYSILCEFLLQPWLYRRWVFYFFCLFVLQSPVKIFTENYYTSRCTFDMFFEVGDFHVLLFHHLDPLSVEIQEENCHRNQHWSRKTGTVIDELLKSQCRQLWELKIRGRTIPGSVLGWIPYNIVRFTSRNLTKILQ